MPLNRDESPYHRPQDPRLARRRAKEDEAALKQERATPTLAGPGSRQSGSPAHANAGAGEGRPYLSFVSSREVSLTLLVPPQRAMSVKPVLPSRGMESLDERGNLVFFCGVCCKNKPRDAFSSTQLNDARRRISRSLRDGNELKPKDFPRCHTCTNAQIKEIFCSQCRRTQPSHLFSEAMRAASSGAICKPCQELAKDRKDSMRREEYVLNFTNLRSSTTHPLTSSYPPRYGDESGAPKQRPGWSAEQAYGVPPPPTAGVARQGSGSAKPDQWSAAQEQKTMPAVIYEDEDEW
ncbi:hypothetical protein Rhopal_004648-T1 [Rhodotorula paludigena]|uniref:Stc1 domain-containing protein n=1 Tax=Rhodotorula paludigena TaxID=86838 RepID=A0AAV5GGD6_9BASI|nr:hypothetical protein Rhopal_004648-T1 [Rhodotorula paludigena]